LLWERISETRTSWLGDFGSADCGGVNLLSYVPLGSFSGTVAAGTGAGERDCERDVDELASGVAAAGRTGGAASLFLNAMPP
jgi:hypothetical protein